MLNNKHHHLIHFKYKIICMQKEYKNKLNIMKTYKVYKVVSMVLKVIINNKINKTSNLLNN